MALVASYGPNVNRELLRRLALSFADLRRMSDEGLLGYISSHTAAICMLDMVSF